MAESAKFLGQSWEVVPCAKLVPSAYSRDGLAQGGHFAASAPACKAGRQALTLAREVRDVEVIGTALQALAQYSNTLCTPRFLYFLFLSRFASRGFDAGQR